MNAVPPRLLGFFVMWCVSGVVLLAQPYTFRTLVGNPASPGRTDGTNALALFNAPAGLAVAPGGRLHVADPNVMRTVTAGGSNWVVVTVAGVALVHGFEDGTNSGALFDGMQGVAVDSAGVVYIADTINNAVRKMALYGTNWVVTTLAGGGRLLPGTADGTNSAARFDHPYGIAADSLGNLYVADTYNQTVRKVAPSGTNWVVSTLAGKTNTTGFADGTNNVARFDNPSALCVDSDGAIYVADFGNQLIRKLVAIGTNWVVTTRAGLPGQPGSTDGPTNVAQFNGPLGIAIDAAHNLFVTDSGNNVVRRISPAGQVSTVAGSPGLAGFNDGTGAAARFNGPSGIGVDSAGTVYVADTGNHCIRAGQIAPVLQTSRLTSKLVVSWPVAFSNMVLETCLQLPPAGSWTTLTPGITQAGDTYLLTNSTATGSQFYRLHKLGP